MFGCDENSENMEEETEAEDVEDAAATRIPRENPRADSITGHKNQN